MKKILVGFIIFMLTIVPVYAYKDKTNSININVFIDKKGNAEVTETWDTEVASGTENYKQMLDLKDSIVTDFIVSDETNKIYENINNWNSSASLNDKKFKSGIKEITDGIELCWGVSEYGHKVYTIKYKVSNFVQQYNDAQGIYFTLVNKSSIPPQNVNIVIASNYAFSNDNTYLWAYGYQGTDIISNSSIILKGTNFSENDYVVVLAKFKKNFFMTSSKVNSNFDKVLEQAEKGVEDDTEKKEDLFTIIYATVAIIFILNIATGYDIIFAAIAGYIWFSIHNPLLALLFYTLYYIYSRIWTNREDVKTYIKSIVRFNNTHKNKDIEYYRDIPFDSNIDMLIVTAINYDVIGKTNGLLGAYFLKWFREGKLHIVTDELGRKQLDLTSLSSTDKNELFIMQNIKIAAGNDNLLAERELKRWMKINYHDYNNILRTSFYNGANRLYQQGYVVNKSLIGTKFDTSALNATEKLDLQAANLRGLKKYLINFTSIKDKEPMEISLWEDYLIAAQVLGIANKVMRQLRKLYPDFEKSIKLELEELNHIASLSNYAYRSYYRSSFRENIRSNSSRHDKLGSRLFGSGGSSSLGGGSGSRGGGSSASSGRR